MYFYQFCTVLFLKLLKNFHFIIFTKNTCFLLKNRSYICVITSLFSAGREGTDKGEGVPPRAVGCIWAVCYNGAANGKRAEYM